MRAARRTLALQLLVACTCATLIASHPAINDDPQEDYDFEPTEPYRPEDDATDDNSSQPPQGQNQLTRKLWDCVEDNNTLTCMKDLVYEAFDSKVMRNPNLTLLKRHINKYMDEYLTPLKRKQLSNANSLYDRDLDLDLELGDYRQANATIPPTTTTTLPDDDDSDRGMKKKMMDFLPFVIGPALLMAGVMPWVIPPLKMMVMFVAMINQFAFSSALFSLVRNFVFNRREEEHVFYINHGYQDQDHNQHQHQQKHR